MARAIDFDENGDVLLTDGVPFGPLPAKLMLADLEVGDVLIWYFPGASRISSAIREFSGGPYSHVGIYIGNGLSVDAGPDGVKESQITMPPGSYAHVLRKANMTSCEKMHVVAAAKRCIGYRYAWFDAITLPLRRLAYWRKFIPRKPSSAAIRFLFSALGTSLIFLRKKCPPYKKIFCSQIIVKAYAAMNYFHEDLAEAGVFTPYDLAIQSFFIHEGWLCGVNEPKWHPLDPYSPEPVKQRQWRFSLLRIILGKFDDTST